MKVTTGRIVSTEHVFGDTYRTWFEAPLLLQGAHPGQFLMFRLPDRTDPLLPRPMSYHTIRPDGQVAILYEVCGKGTDLLSHQPADSPVTLWGPLGRGFTVRPDAKNLLLVAGGMGIAPLVWLAEESISQGKSVTCIVGARTSALLPPATLLPPKVKIVATTEDGSMGRKGFATQPFEELLPRSDQVFACGPRPMYAAMAEVVRRLESRTSVQVLLETNMACGVGLCYGCAVETKKGIKQVCRDGPRFELREVF